ncbi:MAG TPA: UbiD family decarboxylase [Planctomicrobium sp.]|nr:UbiD family decarboxylase [Planctomicrobium sp.]
MAFDDLTQFLQAASDAGELERVDVELDPVEEIAAVTQEICREFREQSPVILCERPVRSHIPVVTNLLGNRQRFLRATGCQNIDEVVTRFQTAFNPFPVAERDWKFGIGGGAGLDRSRFHPRVIRRGACQQVVKLGKELNLREFPIPKNWQGETRPTITAGLVISESIDGKRTLERVPVGVIDQETLVLHWQPEHVGLTQWKQAQARKRPFPVAIALGGDPLLSYVASLPLPTMMDPWIFAGILRQECVNLIRARSVELDVPADAEIIFEGYLEPGSEAVSGTVGGPSGLLETHSGLPVMRLSAITHRANPLFPASVPAFGFQEEFVTSLLTEKLLLSLLRLVNSDVVDLHLPACGGHRQVVFVGTTATQATQVRQLFQAVGSLPISRAAGILVAVPSHVELRTPDAVWREVALRFPGVSPNFAPSSMSSGDGRLWIDAASRNDESTLHASGGRRCESTGQVLSRIAARLGAGAVEELETTAETSLS